MSSPTFNPNHPANASVITGTQLSGSGGLHPDLQQRIAQIQKQLPNALQSGVNGWSALFTSNNGVLFAVMVGRSYAALRLPPAEIERAIQQGGVRSVDEGRWMTKESGEKVFVDTPMTMGDDWVILKNLWGFAPSWWQKAYEYTGQITAQADTTSSVPAGDDAAKKALEERMLSYRQMRAKPTSDYKGALEGFTAIIESNPTYASAYYERAQTYNLLNQSAEAIADLTRVIELDPSNAFAYHYRGQYRKAAGVMDEALADYQKAAQLMPPRSFWDEVDQSTIATILKRRGDIDGAIAIYDKLIRLWPQKSKVYPFGTGAYYEQRALLLVQKKRYDEAIADYEKIKIMQPQSATQIEAEIAKLNQLKAQ